VIVAPPPVIGGGLKPGGAPALTKVGHGHYYGGSAPAEMDGESRDGRGTSQLSLSS